MSSTILNHFFILTHTSTGSISPHSPTSSFCKIWFIHWLFQYWLRRKTYFTKFAAQKITDRFLPCPNSPSSEMRNLFQNVCDKSKVPLFTAHSLRHYVATHLNDLYRAQEILGHNNLKTTEIYLHDLGIDREAANIFEAITHKITHGNNDTQNKKGHLLQ